MNKEQRRKIEIFDLPQNGWKILEDRSIVLLINTSEYVDKWFISKDASLITQEREYSDNPNNWVLMCPDCGHPYNSEEHENSY